MKKKPPVNPFAEAAALKAKKRGNKPAFLQAEKAGDRMPPKPKKGK